MYIKELIEKFRSEEKLPQQGPFPSSADTVAYQAHREAEKIEDLKHLPELAEFVAKAKKHDEISDISFILGHFIKNTDSQEAKDLFLTLCQKPKISSMTLYKIIDWAAVSNLKECYAHVLTWMKLEPKRNYHHSSAMTYLGRVIGKEATEILGNELDHDCYGKCAPFYAVLALDEICDEAARPYLERAMKRTKGKRKRDELDVFIYSNKALTKLNEQKGKS